MACNATPTLIYIPHLYSKLGTHVALVWFTLACVASVSFRFHSKERPRKGIFGFGRAGFSVFFPRPRTCAIFRAVFESRSSFFAPKPHGNACYAGQAYVKLYHVTKFPFNLSFTDHYFYTSLIKIFTHFFSHKNCFEVFLSAHFVVLRNSQLESDVCRFSYVKLKL